MFLFTNILGASMHRKSLAINILSTYNVSNSDVGAGDVSYRLPLEVSQPSGRHKYGNQESCTVQCMCLYYGGYEKTAYGAQKEGPSVPGRS